MKFEFSAGGIVYKPIRQAQGKKDILLLVAQHSQHHGWVFPKGLIGDHVKGEKKEETAVREVKEETGIEATILQAFEPVTYWYKFNNEKIKKTVYYFLMEYRGGDTRLRDHEMENVEWVSIDKVEARLTYKSDKQVFGKARIILEKLIKE